MKGLGIKIKSKDIKYAPPKKHPDIDKRVKWRNASETGYGTLMAVDCDRTSTPYLIQREREYGFGWTLEETDIEPWYKRAREQGVKDGTENLYWVSGYEVVGNHEHKYALICKCGKEK